MEILLHHDDLKAQYAGHFANSSHSSDRHSERSSTRLELAATIKTWGREFGFQQVGVADH
jgi:hypothetical protein